jgi:hypothetical protein
MGHRHRRLALDRQPTRCHLLPGHGCPVSSSCGEEGGGANPDATLRHGGKTSSSSPPPGELTTVVVVMLQGEEYHVVAAVARHELETPEAEHHPGLKRLLKTTHLELNGKVFINTQQAPTWRANCRRFGPGGPSTEPTSEFIDACPCPDGLAQDGTQGGMRLVLSRTGVLVVGVTSVTRERERESRGSRLLPRLPAPLPRKALDLPFYRCKESVQMYNGGVAMCYVASGEVPEPCVYGNVAVGETLEPCRSTAIGMARILLTFPCFRRGLRTTDVMDARGEPSLPVTGVS